MEKRDKGKEKEHKRKKKNPLDRHHTSAIWTKTDHQVRHRSRTKITSFLWLSSLINS